MSESSALGEELAESLKFEEWWRGGRVRGGVPGTAHVAAREAWAAGSAYGRADGYERGLRFAIAMIGAGAGMGSPAQAETALVEGVKRVARAGGGK